MHTAAFSPNGHVLITGYGGQFTGKVQSWNVLTGKLIKTLATGKIVDCRVKGQGPVWALAFSPDGKTVAVGTVWESEGSPGGEIIIIDARSGKLRRKLHDVEDAVLSLGYSPGGKLIAAGGYDRYVRIFDVHSGKRLRTYQGGRSEVLAVQFSPDARTVISGDEEQTVRWWNEKTGKLARVRTKVGGAILAISADGRMAASAGEKLGVRLLSIH